MSLTVAEGEIVSLVGANGAGKSTLLYTIAGSLTPTAGRVGFLGQDLRHMRADRLARLGISLVPEGRQVFGALVGARQPDPGNLRAARRSLA